ncbi:MAG: ABC transporter permease [Sphaerochaetaceae bacterium]|nr:ABC transporter permease [Sphaerochaetaceae bacterium]MDC7238260.1 ABC transporter permease [Sphaerochaetaceae bacterium]
MIALITSIIAAAIRIATPLTFAGIGEAINEKSGVINIGLDSIMLSGAFVSFYVCNKTDNILLGVFAGLISGIIISLFHGYLAIKGKANQTIIGLALNFFALGLTSFLFLVGFGTSTELPTCRIVSNISIPLLNKIPILGEVVFSQNIFVYLLFLTIILSYIIMYKTSWGISLISVGENPKAADTAGIDVKKTRYLACIINGLLGGLAGSYLTLAQLGFFMENITNGKGYMALVAVILGKRNPLGIFLAALVIGVADATQIRLQTAGIPLPSEIFTMLPYFVAMIVLLFSIKNNKDPLALGTPYERNAR